MQPVILKPGKEKPLLHKHHWIFSGAVEKLPSFTNGDILKVTAANGTVLGHAYFNKKAQIIGRMLAFGDADPVNALKQNMRNAIAMRHALMKGNAYRLINGEGDGIPGLVVDQYDRTLVIQVSTLGMEKLKDLVVQTLIELVNPTTILEKSNLPSRKEEGLQDFQGKLWGEDVEAIEVLENDLKFLVNPLEGQKTGFFLDQREMRAYVRSIAKNQKVLNCFSYTGGFSVYAKAGGATQVDSVDISDTASRMGEQNFALNSMKGHFITEDVFKFLREQPLDYNIVILDPPAFAKRKKDVVQGCRGYKDINRVAMQKMPPRSILITCSCSYYVDEALFKMVVFQAAAEAGRSVKIIGKHRQAADHPVNIYHPESDYLKSLVLYIE